MKNYYADWSDEKLRNLVNSIKEKCEDNLETLYYFVWFMKDYGDKNLELKNGEEYSVTVGKSKVFGPMYYFSTKAGEDKISFEFDAFTFREFGFSDTEMLTISAYISEETTGEKPLFVKD